MQQRYISDINLQELTAPEVCAVHMDAHTARWLEQEHIRLLEELDHAASNSPEAISLIDQVSLIAQVLDACTLRQQAVREAA